MRDRRYTSRSREQAIAWQELLREELLRRLHLEDLLEGSRPNPLCSEVSYTKERKTYVLQEMEIRSTPGRRMKIVLTLPLHTMEKVPAVVCVHGHGGGRLAVYDPGSIYHGFAAELASKGVVTISADVGQHEVYESGRTLMGERLWDLMRCIDLVAGLKEVDASRIGCCGLSLGGEMTMWLGAMDLRVAATASSGFLTTMDQMEHNHCMCWKFPGLRELVDYADIYALIAPRPLLCQNGLQEPHDGFYVPLARKAMEEVRIIYEDFGRRDRALLDIHPGAHEIHVPTVLDFFERFLGPLHAPSR